MDLATSIRPLAGATLAVRERLEPHVIPLLVIAEALTGCVYLAGHFSGSEPMLVLGSIHLAHAALHYFGRRG